LGVLCFGNSLFHLCGTMRNNEKCYFWPSSWVFMNNPATPHNVMFLVLFGLLLLCALLCYIHVPPHAAMLCREEHDTPPPHLAITMVFVPFKRTTILPHYVFSVVCLLVLYTFMCCICAPPCTNVLCREEW
jgi:hypothetical protein